MVSKIPDWEIKQFEDMDDIWGYVEEVNNKLNKVIDILSELERKGEE